MVPITDKALAGVAAFADGLTELTNGSATRTRTDHDRPTRHVRAPRFDAARTALQRNGPWDIGTKAAGRA
jgi:hypothetical protein